MKKRYELYDGVNSSPVLSSEKDLTQEEILRDWEGRMRLTDSSLPRWAEDIIDALPAPSRAELAPQTLKAYTDKKALRNQKPEGD